MGRSQRNARMGKKTGGRATAPAGMSRPGTPVTKTQGRNDPDRKSQSPVVPDDATARVIKTRTS